MQIIYLLFFISIIFLNFFHYINYTMNSKTKALFLFLTLLFGLVLCSFLGGKCNKEGYENSNNTDSITITPVILTSDNSNMNPVTNPNMNPTTIPNSIPNSNLNTTANRNYDNYNHYANSTLSPITTSQYYGSTGTPVINPMANNINMPPTQNSESFNNMTNTSNGYGEQYFSTLPPGIPKSQIMPGNEDLYILKSEIVPPVCPVCPSITHSFNSENKKKSCPPCPACARCPESPFECKKVPNYNALNNSDQPIPVLNDFSSFGM